MHALQLDNTKAFQAVQGVLLIAPVRAPKLKRTAAADSNAEPVAIENTEPVAAAASLAPLETLHRSGHQCAAYCQQA
jgi:hypothetical protein